MEHLQMNLIAVEPGWVAKKNAFHNKYGEAGKADDLAISKVGALQLGSEEVIYWEEALIVLCDAEFSLQSLTSTPKVFLLSEVALVLLQTVEGRRDGAQTNTDSRNQEKVKTYDWDTTAVHRPPNMAMETHLTGQNGP